MRLHGIQPDPAAWRQLGELTATEAAVLLGQALWPTQGYIILNPGPEVPPWPFRHRDLKPHTIALHHAGGRYHLITWNQP